MYNYVVFFFFVLKDLEERVRYGDFLVRLLEYILYMYIKWMEWNYNNCLCCCIFLLVVEWIKVVSFFWGLFWEFCLDRFILLYLFFWIEWFGVLILSFFIFFLIIFVLFWLRIGIFFEIKVIFLLLFVCINSSGLVVWLGLLIIFVFVYEIVVLFVFVLFNGSLWVVEFLRSDDRCCFFLVVYLVLLIFV